MTPTAFECGSNSVYCPAGSDQPTPVSMGHYSIGESSRTRHSQLICPKGFYCPESGEKFPCIAGSYGELEGLSVTCSGSVFTSLSDFLM